MELRRREEKSGNSLHDRISSSPESVAREEEEEWRKMLERRKRSEHVEVLFIGSSGCAAPVSILFTQKNTL